MSAPFPQAASLQLPTGETVIFDAELTDWIRSFSWTRERQRGNHLAYYARTKTGRAGRYISMHRLIMGADSGTMVDHVDGNTLNNCRSNLRLATNGQNQWNRAKHGGQHAYKGIRLDQDRVRRANSTPWAARIRVEGRDIFLGYHETPELAARAYDTAALEHFGEFARLNFHRQEAAC